MMPFLNKSAYVNLQLENEDTQKKINAIKDELHRSPTAREEMGDFRSDNPDDKNKIIGYRRLEKNLHGVPDFYFENIGLREKRIYIVPTSDTVQAECDKVNKDAQDSLSKY